MFCICILARHVVDGGRNHSRNHSAKIGVFISLITVSAASNNMPISLAYSASENDCNFLSKNLIEMNLLQLERELQTLQLLSIEYFLVLSSSRLNLCLNMMLVHSLHSSCCFFITLDNRNFHLRTPILLI